MNTWINILALSLTCLACGVEKGGGIKDIITEEVQETEPTPGGEIIIPNLQGVVNGEAFSIGKAWIASGTNVISFSQGSISGCDDESATVDFTLSNFPTPVGDATGIDIHVISLDAEGVTESITDLMGSVTVLRSTTTDTEARLDVSSAEQPDAYYLEGDFSATKCAATEDTDDTTPSPNGTIGNKSQDADLYEFWNTDCDADTKTRFALRIKDTNTFTLTTFLYEENTCTTLLVTNTRAGTVTLQSETVTTGASINLSYDSATIKFYNVDEANSANSYLYDSPTVSVIGLCDFSTWTISTAKDVSNETTCFPYDQAVTHANRQDRMIYQVLDETLKLSLIEDPIYETQSRPTVSIRPTSFTHTFNKGTLEADD